MTHSLGERGRGVVLHVGAVVVGVGDDVEEFSERGEVVAIDRGFDDGLHAVVAAG